MFDVKSTGPRFSRYLRFHCQPQPCADLSCHDMSHIRLKSRISDSDVPEIKAVFFFTFLFIYLLVSVGFRARFGDFILVVSSFRCFGFSVVHAQINL